MAVLEGPAVYWYEVVLILRNALFPTVVEK
jgi:hypothetical protein